MCEDVTLDPVRSKPVLDMSPDWLKDYWLGGSSGISTHALDVQHSIGVWEKKGKHVGAATLPSTAKGDQPATLSIIRCGGGSSK